MFDEVEIGADDSCNLQLDVGSPTRNILPKLQALDGQRLPVVSGLFRGSVAF